MCTSTCIQSRGLCQLLSSANSSNLFAIQHTLAAARIISNLKNNKHGEEILNHYTQQLKHTSHLIKSLNTEPQEAEG